MPDSAPSDTPASVVEIKPGRASVEKLLGAIDAALRSGPPGLRVRVPLGTGDRRMAAMAELCAADHRIELGASEVSGTEDFVRASPRPRRHRRADAAPPPEGTMAQERAEHLRHRARGATMRARIDRGHNRLSRERLQVRHERARLRIAEERLGATGAGEWVRWRSRAVSRRAAAVPLRVASLGNQARTYARRARRYAADRMRSRGTQHG